MRARKRFGQHFLKDGAAIDRIVEAIRPERNDFVVEIGPGLGALTRPLLERLAHLHVVEIDRDLAARLTSAYPPAKLTVHQADALGFDFAALGRGLRIVGNLPYNISTPLLFHLAATIAHMRDGHFMLQKEVVERMVARPSTRAYGRLSVMLQCRFAMQILFGVAPAAFAPPPQVESAVVRMLPLSQSELPVELEKPFATIVRAAFAQRRKTLRNALQAHLSQADFEALKLDPRSRAENLDVHEFAAIATYVALKAKAVPSAEDATDVA